MCVADNVICPGGSGQINNNSEPLSLNAANAGTALPAIGMKSASNATGSVLPR